MIDTLTPPIAHRSLYVRTYARYGGTLSATRIAQALAYAAVAKKHGPAAAERLASYHTANRMEIL